MRGEGPADMALTQLGTVYLPAARKLWPQACIPGGFLSPTSSCRIAAPASQCLPESPALCPETCRVLWLLHCQPYLAILQWPPGLQDL